jgi:hypothetical protein
MVHSGETTDKHLYRHGRDEVPDMSFLFNAGVFERGKRIDPRAGLKGRAH